MTDLSSTEIDRVVALCLDEDLGEGDLTSRATIPAEAAASFLIRARQPIVLAGLPVARRVFETVSAAIRFDARQADGDRVAEGAVIAAVEGPVRDLLTAERAALNLLQTLSGIATTTRTYVDRIAGTGATLLDTRKTIPGLRLMCKYATRMGGASNHRLRLDDLCLIKDNHIAAAGGVGAAVRAAQSQGLTRIEVECDTLEQVEEALATGVTMLLLDNMDTATLRRAVDLNKGRATLEASGGVTLETIRPIAETGVDFVSVGRITQGAPAVDIGLDEI